MSGTANPPAGWYPAPHAGGQLRYWDGARWLEGAPPPAPPVLTSAPAAAPGVPAHPVATVPGAPPRKKHTVLIITLSVVAVVVVLIAAGIFAFSVFLGSIAEPIYAAHVSRVETSGSQATAYVVVENIGDGSARPTAASPCTGRTGPSWGRRM